MGKLPYVSRNHRLEREVVCSDVPRDHAPMKRTRQGLIRQALISFAVGTAALTALAQTPQLTEEEWITRVKADSAQRGQSITDEQEMKLRLQYRRMQQFANSVGNKGGPAPAGAMSPRSAAPVAAGMTTTALAAQIAQLPPEKFVDVVAKKDGFELNGRRVIDPEGRISRFIASSRTGDYTYMIDRSDGGKTIKRGRGQAAPVSLAVSRGSPGSWEIQFVDGQSMQVDSMTLTPLGVLGTRDASVFDLAAGQVIKAYALPEGWSPVPLQRGDVSGTRHILVERNASGRPKTGSIDGLFQAAKRLTGTETPDDYALMNLETGQLTTLAIDISGKSVTRMSDCRRKNSVVNTCSHAESYDSLWNPDGSKNAYHYFWRANWMDTPQGPMAVSYQRGVKEVRLFDLRSGKEVVAFRRGMGISDWSAQLASDGRVSVGAKWLFKAYAVDDARRLLDEGLDARGKDLEGTIVAGKPEAAEEVKASGAPASAAEGSN